MRSMTDRYRRPDWVRRLNAMASAVGDVASVVPISADEILEAATIGTDGSYGDLGDGDWENRFRLLVDAVNQNRLHVVGRLMTREELLRCLRTRLQLASARKAEPAIAEEEIVAPVVVTGPARSGTSITFELIGLDPTLQTPVAADVIHPASRLDDAARARATECEQELWADVQPEFAAIHELRSDLPVECVTIAAPSFAGNHWLMVLQELGDWAPDPVADFAFHRALLQTVQYGREQRSWLIKTPAYLMMIDALLAAYPDARIIQTHRDPVKTMPSTVSTTAMVQWMRTDHVDLDLLAPLISSVFSDALLTVTRRRAAGEIEAPVGDVRFTELLRDPVAAIGGAYDSIGRELTSAHADAIAAYVSDKPKGKFGTHRYTPDDWGFDEVTLRAELADYVEHFAIELET